jgi:urease accessory protein
MSGLHGHLELAAALDDRGLTALRRQSFAAPIHVSKPHHDAGWQVVNLASPTPGLLAGDRVEVRVEVAAGARLLLTAPSANRIHTMAEGYAELTQHLRVAAGGWLEVFPEYLIPQAGARYRQHTRIEVEPGGHLLWSESIAPGRTAHGEAFAYAELRFATDLLVGDRPIVRERYRLVPDEMIGLRAQFPTAYYASIVCVSPSLPDDLAAVRALGEDLHRPECWVGASRLGTGAWVVKVVAADSPALRATTAALRLRLHALLGGVPANLRRVMG